MNNRLLLSTMLVVSVVSGVIVQAMDREETMPLLNQQAICSICYDQQNPNEFINYTQVYGCTHYDTPSCRQCIIENIRRGNLTCPLCRRDPATSRMELLNRLGAHSTWQERAASMTTHVRLLLPNLLVPMRRILAQVWADYAMDNRIRSVVDRSLRRNHLNVESVALVQELQAQSIANLTERVIALTAQVQQLQLPWYTPLVEAIARGDVSPELHPLELLPEALYGAQ